MQKNTKTEEVYVIEIINGKKEIVSQFREVPIEIGATHEKLDKRTKEERELMWAMAI